MSALKIDWEETSGVLKKHAEWQTRISTAWSLEPSPGYPDYTKVTSLGGSGEMSLLPGRPGPFNILNVAIPFEIASRYVEDCLAKNALIDLTNHNIPGVIARFGNIGPERHDPPSIHEAVKKTPG